MALYSNYKVFTHNASEFPGESAGFQSEELFIHASRSFLVMNVLELNQESKYGFFDHKVLLIC